MSERMRIRVILGLMLLSTVGCAQQEIKHHTIVQWEAECPQKVIEETGYTICSFISLEEDTK